MGIELNYERPLLNNQIAERFLTEFSTMSIARHISPRTNAYWAPIYRDHFVMILVEELNKPLMNAIRYAGFLAGETVAVHIQINLSNGDSMEDNWKSLSTQIRLVMLYSADGSIIQPLKSFIDGMLTQKKRGRSR